MKSLVNINNQRVAGAWMLASGLLGLYASLVLLFAKTPVSADGINDLTHKAASSLLSAVPGLGWSLLAFSMLVALSLALSFGGSLPKAIWVFMGVGSILGVVFSLYSVIEGQSPTKLDVCILSTILVVLPIALFRALKSTDLLTPVLKKMMVFWWVFPLVAISITIIVAVLS